jgi:multicomponent Na+:H+ antiporter subunit E
VKRIAGLVLVLAVFWLVNSGYFIPLLLSLGALSVTCVIVLVMRLEKTDGITVPPVFLSTRLPSYLLWLLWEIVKSNIDVIRHVWLRQPAISPTIFKVRASQKTDLGKVFYANSITLTPGTVTLDIQDDILEVHALTRAGAQGVQQGDMDRKVSWLEGQA